MWSRTPQFRQLTEPCPEQHLAIIQGKGVMLPVLGGKPSNPQNVITFLDGTEASQDGIPFLV